MEYGIQIRTHGIVYPIERDVAHQHPDAVLNAMGVETETELQGPLDAMSAADWYGSSGEYLGPDAAGLELFFLAQNGSMIVSLAEPE